MNTKKYYQKTTEMSQPLFVHESAVNQYITNFFWIIKRETNCVFTHQIKSYTIYF